MKDAIPSNRLAAVNIRTVSASALTPSIAEASNILAPMINGVNRIMKLDRFAAISGKPDVSPAPKPPMMLPIKLPIAYPIAANVSPPLDINSFTPGI